MNGKDILSLEKGEKEELDPNKLKNLLFNIKSDFF